MNHKLPVLSMKEFKTKIYLIIINIFVAIFFFCMIRMRHYELSMKDDSRSAKFYFCQDKEFGMADKTVRFVRDTDRDFTQLLDPNLSSWGTWNFSEVGHDNSQASTLNESQFSERAANMNDTADIINFNFKKGGARDEADRINKTIQEEVRAENNTFGEHVTIQMEDEDVVKDNVYEKLDDNGDNQEEHNDGNEDEEDKDGHPEDEDDFISEDDEDQEEDGGSTGGEEDDLEEESILLRIVKRLMASLSYFNPGVNANKY